MKLIQALVRPGKLDPLRGALEDARVPSITIMSVRYRGPEKRPVTACRGFLISEDYVDRAVGLILRTARTGTPSDGHVSISPIEYRYHIHSGHRETC